MKSTPGIKSILLCGAGTLASTPTTPLFIGIGGKSKMTISPYKTVKDSRNRQLKNMLMVQIEAESHQVTLKNFNTLLGLLNLNADIQVITDKQSAATGSEDVFKFTAATLKLGIGFEYALTMNGRTLKLTMKGAAPYNTVKALLDAGDSETPVAVSGVDHIGGEDYSQQRPMDIEAIQSPISTSLCDLADLDDLKLSIKTKDTENAYGQTLVDGFTCKLETLVRDASVSNLIAQYEKDINSSILVKINNEGSYYDAHDFAAGVLTPAHEPEISDDNRKVKLQFEGDVRTYDIALEVGADKGGAAADAGLNGGTLKIGY